jgi:hypothetical protein
MLLTPRVKAARVESYTFQRLVTDCFTENAIRDFLSEGNVEATL